MTKDEHDFEELTAPAATAKELQISVATLRKYSLIIEKVTSKPNYYARTKQNARLYSKKDIQDLKDFHKLAQDNGLTLREAAQQIFAISDKNQESHEKDDDKKQEVMTASQVMKLLTALQQTIGQQNAALKKMQKQLNQVEKQNQDLLTKQQKLGTSTANEDDFASLPDISGIVADNNLTSKIDDDGAKSSEQVHEEILSKAKENAEKQVVNEHRTLSDMQVETEKKHWWQKFFDM